MKAFSVCFNDTSRIFQRHRQELFSVMEAAGEAGVWLNGSFTEGFCQEFRTYCGARFCVPVGNGTDALEIAIKAVLGPCPKFSDEIITVANAGGYSSTACYNVGVTPVYVDVVDANLLLDIDSAIGAISESTKAIVATHLYGGAVDVPLLRSRLQAIGREDVRIIEDCAQAHGAEVHGRRVGSMGDIAAFSFYPTKNLAALGDAGAILTSDEALFCAVQSLRQYGWTSKYNVGIPHGRNSRMDEMQAGFLSVFLPHLDEWNRRRRKIYQRYKASSSGLRFLQHEDEAFVAHLAVVRTARRNEFQRHLRAAGVDSGIHYPILDCDQQGWMTLPRRIGFSVSASVTTKATCEIVSLPCFPTMSETEVNTVCEALANWEE